MGREVYLCILNALRKHNKISSVQKIWLHSRHGEAYLSSEEWILIFAKLIRGESYEILHWFLSNTTAYDVDIDALFRVITSLSCEAKYHEIIAWALLQPLLQFGFYTRRCDTLISTDPYWDPNFVQSLEEADWKDQFLEMAWIFPQLPDDNIGLMLRNWQRRCAFDVLENILFRRTRLPTVINSLIVEYL